MFRAWFFNCPIAMVFFCSSLSFGQPIELTVDQSQSTVMVTIAGETETSAVTGTGEIELVPMSEPFETARITDLNLIVADGFTIQILGGLVTASADPGEVSVVMATAGPAGNVDGANQFDQLDNSAGLLGIVDVVDPLNLVGGTGPLDLGTLGKEPFDMLDVQLDVLAGMLSVTTGVDIAVPVTDTIDVVVNVSVVLTGKIEEFVAGDVNCDGVVDLLDVEPFVDLIVTGTYSEKADINGDGVVDLLDVGPFVELLTGG